MHDLAHWERFEPNLGDNHRLPPEKRFFLEVAAGLSKAQLKKAKRALDFSSLSLNAEAVTAEAKTSKADDETDIEALQRCTEKAMAVLCVERLATEWGGFVRVGSAGHTINGLAIASLKDYLGVIIEQPGRFNVIELSKVLAQLNSVTGTHALFFERLSGGPISTVAPRADEEGERTESR